MVDELHGFESLVGGYAKVIKHGVNATDSAKGIQSTGPSVDLEPPWLNSPHVLRVLSHPNNRSLF
jgi:hypothetical protein